MRSGLKIFSKSDIQSADWRAGDRSPLHGGKSGQCGLRARLASILLARLATDLSKPSFFVDNIRVGNDSVFGTQIFADFDAYQLFGIRNAPEGTDWD